MDRKAQREPRGERLLAGVALLSALAASSCCVLPLLLVSVGVGGAWIGALAGLAPYQPVFLAIAAGCIAAGFWSVHRRNQVACAGPECGTPASRRITTGALWAGVVLLLATGSAEWWARLL
jgi:mercuric ion transport protein